MARVALNFEVSGCTKKEIPETQPLRGYSKVEMYDKVAPTP